MSAEEESETAWLETVTIGGFRAWHIIAICLGISLSILIMVCCCIRFRIPRTKQEIEADYQRKQITKKFREKLQQIKNSEMDEMDLQKGHSKKESTDVDRKIASILQENLCPYLPNIAVIAHIQAEYLSAQNSCGTSDGDNTAKDPYGSIKFKSNIQVPA